METSTELSQPLRHPTPSCNNTITLTPNCTASTRSFAHLRPSDDQPSASIATTCNAPRRLARAPLEVSSCKHRSSHSQPTQPSQPARPAFLARYMQHVSLSCAERTCAYASSDGHYCWPVRPPVRTHAQQQGSAHQQEQSGASTTAGAGACLCLWRPSAVTWAACWWRISHVAFAALF